MTGLYKRLSDLGLPRPYVKNTILPSWWDDEAAQSRSGYVEALMLVARHSGLSVRALGDASTNLEVTPEVHAKFKKTEGTSEAELALARTLATQVARLVAMGVEGESSLLPTSASELRQALLDSGAGSVSLDGLLDYCWSVGLPVIHVSSYPRKCKKMHGLAARIDGRPVIIIGSGQTKPAWLLFILAHEIGHIACGHVSNNEVIVDETVDRDSTDDEEKEANRFALELLNGDPDRRYVATGRWPNAHELAERARQVGVRDHIDPGHVVLNYGHSMGKSFFPVANAALGILEPHGAAPDLIRKKLAKNLDWSRLPEDHSEFVMRMTKTTPVSADQ